MAPEQWNGRGAPVRYERDQVEFARAVAFFDATFAIATTLLAATLNPGPDGWSSWSNLVETLDGPFLAFGISFVVIASYWWANHRFIASLRALSPRLIVGTVVLLGFVVLLPITTEGLGQDVGNLEVTTVVYAINVALVSSSEWVLYRIALGQDLFLDTPSPAEATASAVAQLTPSAIFLLSIPVALLGSPAAARWMWISLIVVSPIVGRWSNRIMSRTGSTVPDTADAA